MKPPRNPNLFAIPILEYVCLCFKMKTTLRENDLILYWFSITFENWYNISIMTIKLAGLWFWSSIVKQTIFNRKKRSDKIDEALGKMDSFLNLRWLFHKCVSCFLVGILTCNTRDALLSAVQLFEWPQMCTPKRTFRICSALSQNPLIIWTKNYLWFTRKQWPICNRPQSPHC